MPKDPLTASALVNKKRLDASSSVRPSLFEPGRNCWRIEAAKRAAFLVDGEAYYRAFREVAIEAQRSIFVLGWDFDTRIRMLIDRDSDGFPDQLGQFLRALLVRRRRLHIYILTWDFHVIYLGERQWWLPSNLLVQRRLHFKKDGSHPVGASHHQKVVVVDDAIAFVGGLDFAQCRWDARSHRAQHPDRRLLSNDTPCRPFHDVQMAVDGEAARTLGRLARKRWLRATGHRIKRARVQRLVSHWPSSVEPDVRDVAIAIARTEPEFTDRPEVREVEGLLTDLLKAARQWIYIETQYFTSAMLAEVLAARLQESDGPEIVLILHPNSDGWLEQHTMDVLRGRVLKRLRAVDRFHRLGLYYPYLPDLKGQCISMHSKVCIVDNEYVRIGSANMSNRSMGFDSECDLALEANGDPMVQQRLAHFRNGLLAEHLDVPVDRVRDTIDERGSLIGAIEGLRGSGRSLEVFDGQIPAEVDEWVPDAEFVDPPRPYETQLVPREHRPSTLRQVMLGTSLLLAVLALAAAWRWSPLGTWIEIPRLLAYEEAFEQSPAAPFITIAGFLIGGLLVAPVTVLITVTVLAFGPLQGFFYSFAGMTFSAILTFYLGRVFGQRLVDRISPRLHRLSVRLAEKGVLAVVTVRVLPVAPFTIVNMVAGATRIRTKDFVVGTIIGELPGLIALSIFVDQITTTIKSPGPGSYAVLAVTAVAIVAVAWMLRHWLTQRTAAQGSGAA
ncbi:MAG: VTT domain-containing protein [Nitrospiraceae bacterium]